MVDKMNYPITKKEVPTFYFIGVTTQKSSIMKVFPLWMKVLGREDIVLEGWIAKFTTIPRITAKQLRR
jgi:shikimate 5-dehydrogenase